MPRPIDRPQLQRGRDALAAGAWGEARDAFIASLVEEESAEALEGLGMAIWWLGDDDARVLEARERAYTHYLNQGERRAAARVAIALGEDAYYLRGEPVVARGWHRRAAELLSTLEPSPEHGWLALSEGDLALTVGDEPAEIHTHARRAAEIGRDLGLVDLEIVARALEGATLVAEGRLSAGLEQLDGSVTIALSGELSDRLAIAYSCCYLLSSCTRVRDFDRAAQWCGRMEAFGKRTRSDALLALCRTQHADVLIARGDWTRAEHELLEATRLFAKTHPTLQAAPLLRLSALRRRQGRTEEAQAILDELEGHNSIPLEQAALALERGDAIGATQQAERFLRRVARGNRMERFCGLELLVRALLATGDRERARATLVELRELAGDEPTTAMLGALHLAEGLVDRAEGNHETARLELEDAIDLLAKAGACYDAAHARLELAACLEALALNPAAERELARARRTLDELARSSQPPRELPHGLEGLEILSQREREVLALLAEGLSNAVIAQRLGISEFTVKRHVQNLLGKLRVPTRAAAAAHAARWGLG